MAAPEFRGLAVPGTVFEVRVTPNASREQVTREESRFHIRVTVVPENGRANKAVVRLLAKTLGVAPTRLTLVRGGAGRDKAFRLD